MKKNKEVKIQFGLWQILTCFIYMFIWAFITLSYLIFIQQNATQLVIETNQKMAMSSQLKDGRRIITMHVNAIENGLGIIKIPFKTEGVLPSTPLIFRIKEQGKKNWYHTDTINLNHFINLPFYPFGFPPIGNSKGRTYDIEIKIMKATRTERYLITVEDKNVQAIYQFKKNTITDNAKSLSIFLLKKYYFFLIQNYIKLITPIIAFFPITYVLIQKKSLTGEGQSFGINIFLFLFALSLAWTTLLIYPMNDFVVFILATLWSIYSIKNCVPVVNNLTISLVALGASMIFLLTGDVQLVENLSIWVYAFFTISLIQVIIQLKQSG